MQNRQTIYFPADGSRVVTGLCPNGEFGAYLETDDGRVRGYGHTRLAAIADLNAELDRADSEGEDYSPKATLAEAAE